MQLLLDNILATIIAGVVFLMLASVMVRQQASNIEMLNHYALKKHETSFIETMKQDFSGAQEVLPTADGSFMFKTQLIGSDPTLYTVQYKRVFSGMRGDDSLFQIQRAQGLDATSLDPDGASMLTVTNWKIEGRTTANKAATPENAEVIYVRFEATLPFSTEAHDNVAISTSRWEATFRPPLLRKNNALL